MLRERLLLLAHVPVFVLGVALVVLTVRSAIMQFVLPRSAPDWLTRLVFLTMRRLFGLRLHGTPGYAERDRVMALFAPVTLLTLPVVWLAIVLSGYTLIYWAIGVTPFEAAFRISGSSLLTLGFAVAEGVPVALLEFSEAAIGLILVALLIAYLPTMYGAFQRRETLVTLLEVRAGSPPSAVELFARFTRLSQLDRLHDLWLNWETWFAELEESHTSLPALAFFRSPQPDHSWVTAAGAVLDSAALAASTIDIPHDVQADLCIRAGYLALRRICDFFALPYGAHPAPDNPISVTRAEFDAACERMRAAGVPLKADREQAWRDFRGWRVNYDDVLLALCSLTSAPPAPWSSDRAPKQRRPKMFQLGK